MRDQSGRAGDCQCGGQRDRRALPRSPAHARPHLREARRSVMSEVRSANTSAVTVVTQTRVEPGIAEGFARWQQKISEVVAAQPGFIKETVMPPSPPTQ